jgi:hypothetical protein
MKVSLSLLIAVMSLGATYAPSEPAGAIAEAARAACYKMTLCGGDGHYMHSGPSGPYTNFHSNCIICIDPGGCHSGCDDQLAERAPEYERLVAAAVNFDAESVIEAAQAIPEFAFYNEERESVQILSCDHETIIASIPVNDRVRRLAAARLRGQPGRAVAATDE